MPGAELLNGGMSPVSPMRRRASSGGQASGAHPQGLNPPQRARTATMLGAAASVFRRLRPDYYLRRDGPTHWFKMLVIRIVAVCFMVSEAARGHSLSTSTLKPHPHLHPTQLAPLDGR